MTEKELLNRVIEGLRKIPVMGEENCGIMHDCIYALKELLRAHEENERAAEKPEGSKEEICPE